MESVLGILLYLLRTFENLLSDAYIIFHFLFVAQRSAQELPLVEKQSIDSFPVTGGKKMIVTGHNFHQDSKVIFVEKAPGLSFIYSAD